MSAHSLLNLFRKGPVSATGFVDDTILIVTGVDITTITSIMQSALNKVMLWGEVHQLIFNPAKTNAMLFTQKKKPIPLLMRGVEIKYVSEARYLGVVLDNKLNWNQLVTERVTSCKKALVRCASVVKKMGAYSRKVSLDMAVCGLSKDHIWCHCLGHSGSSKEG